MATNGHRGSVPPPFQSSVAVAVIRRLTEVDIPFATALCRSAGWNQLPADWLRLIEHEPSGCFVAVLEDNVVGTVTTTRYGRDLAWIGMMLVDARSRRRGVATKLMNASLDYLRDRGVGCIKLDATPTGQSVYEQLGFLPNGLFHRWSRDVETAPRWKPTKETVQLTQANLQLDRSAFAADRSELLKRLAEDSHVVQCEHGYGMAREGYLANYVGPVVADNEQAAKTIIDELLSTLVGQTFWDVPPNNPAATALATSLGFQPVRDLTRMRIQDTNVPPAIDFQFAIADPGTG